MASPLNDGALDALFRTARSQNGWLAEPLPAGALEAIWELASLGPTSANCEPARIVWCVSEDARRRLAACCTDANAPKIAAAPASAIIGYDLAFTERLPQLFPHVDARPWFRGEAMIQSTAMRNGSLQGAYLMMAARALGYDVGPMSGFDPGRVEAEFFAGTTVKPNFICSLGRGDPSKVFPRLPRLAFDEANTVI